MRPRVQPGSKGLRDLRGYETSPINTKDFIYRRNSAISKRKRNTERERGGGGRRRRETA